MSENQNNYLSLVKRVKNALANRKPISKKDKLRFISISESSTHSYFAAEKAARYANFNNVDIFCNGCRDFIKEYAPGSKNEIRILYMGQEYYLSRDDALRYACNFYNNLRDAETIMQVGGQLKRIILRMKKKTNLVDLVKDDIREDMKLKTCHIAADEYASTIESDEFGLKVMRAAQSGNVSEYSIIKAKIKRDSERRMPGAYF